MNLICISHICIKKHAIYIHGIYILYIYSGMVRIYILLYILYIIYLHSINININRNIYSVKVRKTKQQEFTMSSIALKYFNNQKKLT